MNKFDHLKTPKDWAKEAVKSLNALAGREMFLVASKNMEKERPNGFHYNSAFIHSVQTWYSAPTHSYDTAKRKRIWLGFSYEGRYRFGTNGPELPMIEVRMPISIAGDQSYVSIRPLQQKSDVWKGLHSRINNRIALCNEAEAHYKATTEVFESLLAPVKAALPRGVRTKREERRGSLVLTAKLGAVELEASAHRYSHEKVPVLDFELKYDRRFKSPPDEARLRELMKALKALPIV